MRKLLTLIILFVAVQPLAAQDFLPDTPTGMVNDYANMLSSSEESRLERKLRSYRDSTTNALVVVTIESLEGYSRDEVATELFNKWRMWEGERYNGVLILISEGDRELKIEVGYGLEGAIPDVMANRIVQDILVPNLRSQSLYAGLDRATDTMIQLAAGEYTGNPEGNSSDQKIPIDVIIFIIVLILVVISRSKGGGSRRSRTLGPIDILLWGNLLGGGNRGGSSFGGGGGGFGGFGGGGGFGSGGGGAGGSW